MSVRSHAWSSGGRPYRRGGGAGNFDLLRGLTAEGTASEAQVDLLYRQIGQLNVENDSRLSW